MSWIKFHLSNKKIFTLWFCGCIVHYTLWFICDSLEATTIYLGNIQKSTAIAWELVSRFQAKTSCSTDRHTSMLVLLCKNTFRCTLLTQTNPFYVDLKASFVKVLFGKILAIYMCLFKKFAKRVFPTCLWNVFSYSRYLDILFFTLHICYISFHLLTSFLQ